MEISKFDIFWKLGLIVALLACTAFMGYSLQDFSQAGKNCLQQPFIYGAKSFTDQFKSQGYDHMECSCSLTGPYSSTESYAFSEKGITEEKTGRSIVPKLNFTGLDGLIVK